MNLDPYSTHQRLLLKAALVTSGSILELGAGWYSTPLLHQIGEFSNRSVLTIESNQEWFEKFKYFENDWHRLQFVSSWDEFVPSGRYGLVFVDHGPANRRVIEIMRLINYSDVFVIHDTECPAYGYDKVMPYLREIETDKSQIPWTTWADTQTKNFLYL